MTGFSFARMCLLFNFQRTYSLLKTGPSLGKSINYTERAVLVKHLEEEKRAL